MLISIWELLIQGYQSLTGEEALSAMTGIIAVMTIIRVHGMYGVLVPWRPLLSFDPLCMAGLGGLVIGEV